MPEQNQEKKEEIPINIKDYIVDSRKQGFTDSVIIENLRKVKWPEDIITKAIEEANSIAPPVSEPTPPRQTGNTTENAQQPNPSVQTNNNINQTNPQTTDKQAIQQPASKIPDKKPNVIEQSGLFTQPPKEVYPEKQQQAAKEEEKKVFSIMSIIALLLSPIPFIGLGFAMNVLEKPHRYNTFSILLSIIALLLNVGAIIMVVIMIYQIFMLGPDELSGFSKIIVEKFGLV